MQDALAARVGEAAGWKLAVNGKPQMQFFGVSEPVAARVFRADLVESGAALPRRRSHALTIEPEIMAVMGEGAREVSEVIGFHKLKRQPPPHLAIPTTAGTGSENTSMAVIKNSAEKKKVILMDDKLIPAAGFLDPTMTVSMPGHVTAATGMDAMTHAAEAIMSINANPPTDALALHSVTMISQSLPAAVANGEDLSARSMMLVASTQAGQAFQNALVGVVHAMAHALGGIAGVPHGLANGILLAAGMEYNIRKAAERVAGVGAAMGAPQSGDPERDARAAVAAMREFAASVGMPERLRDADVPEDKLVDIANLASSDPAMMTNPVQPEHAEEILNILRANY